MMDIIATLRPEAQQVVEIRLTLLSSEAEHSKAQISQFFIRLGGMVVQMKQLDIGHEPLLFPYNHKACLLHLTVKDSRLIFVFNDLRTHQQIATHYSKHFLSSIPTIFNCLSRTQLCRLAMQDELTGQSIYGFS